MVQWLRLLAPNAGSMSSIPGWGTKIPHAVPHRLPLGVTPLWPRGFADVINVINQLIKKIRR